MKKKAAPVPFTNKELSSWNFIIFLTLAFLLLVIILSTMRGVTADLRSRAGLSCPSIEPEDLPSPETCPGGVWEYKRNIETGCPAFHCEIQPTPSVKK